MSYHKTLRMDQSRLFLSYYTNIFVRYSVQIRLSSILINGFNIETTSIITLPRKQFFSLRQLSYGFLSNTWLVFVEILPY